ncbi:MAG TPA: hypothetical protein VLW50_29385 [Streptosporangiaceae bacterium]|nr:hypothetical protein [Streptosporangiaceae bacterium]
MRETTERELVQMGVAVVAATADLGNASYATTRPGHWSAFEGLRRRGRRLAERLRPGRSLAACWSRSGR